MKPYGRNDIVHQNPRWKKDYHLHNKNHRKLANWWEEFSGNTISRSRIKQLWKKEIKDL